jgi:hypothetical protein
LSELAAARDIDHFNGIVAQSGYEELVLPVEAKVVETPLHSRHGDRFGQDQRTRRLGSCRVLPVGLRQDAEQQQEWGA